MKDPEDTGGTAVPGPDDDRVASPPIFNDDVDLSGVDPLRRAEVRRRIAVVKSFLALAAPDDDDRRHHAEMLDLSINQFKALVRAWLAYPTASNIAQSGRSRGVPRATGPRHLDTEARATAEAAVAKLSPDVTLVRAMGAVASACEARGLEVPKKTTVWKMMIAARRLQVDQSGRGVIVVGRCWLRLPVMDGETLVTPSVALAVRAYDAAIVGATLRSDAVTGAALVALAASQPDMANIDIDEGFVNTHSADAQTIATLSSPSVIRSRLSRIIGNRIGKVRPIFKTGAEARPERLLRSRKDRPLSQADAAAVIRDAIDAHNAERGAGPAIWID
ncbi:MAG TPA: hypothetical protein VF695_07735 [Sphingomonas sp.]|jgi:hypothetical protein